ncbi:Transposase [Piscirickettsia salmonis]|uniref:Transposase n=1 Tax=Piscirickettsia salmonis TaxID=1238 RepID=A0AAC9EUR5_PISSA|nr:transposase [Piscirickettsia salmonis LF-89 = ATCC VR-1361]ALB22111.1 transposase [Piscirickettsia salmonis]ALY02234.1 transposase [Piscirickettsia salmonis]AMA41747.1 transposase [Piscirickettsia salmonis]AOS34226.1 transposase [Piscirickettsia salmonis]
MKDKKQYKRYSTAFKEEAVALVTEQGYTAQQAADAVAVRTNMIYRWKDQHDKEANSTLTPDEKAELQSLRKK